MAEIIVHRDFGHNAKVVAAFFSVREPEREKEREREREFKEPIASSFLSTFVLSFKYIPKV